MGVATWKCKVYDASKISLVPLDPLYLPEKQRYPLKIFMGHSFIFRGVNLVLLRVFVMTTPHRPLGQPPAGEARSTQQPTTGISIWS